MKLARVVIAAVLFLASGVWTLFAYCHGTTGFNFAVPADGTSLHADVTTTGIPVLVGLPLVGLGGLLLLIAFISAIVVQFRGNEHVSEPETSARRREPFDDVEE
jgi:hypothetical protein